MLEKILMRHRSKRLEGELTEGMFLSATGYARPDEILYVAMQNPLCTPLGCRLPKSEDEANHPVFGATYITTGFLEKAEKETENFIKTGAVPVSGQSYTKRLGQIIQMYDESGDIGKLRKLGDYISLYPDCFDPRKRESVFYSYKGWQADEDPAGQGAHIFFYNMWFPPFSSIAKNKE